MSYSHNRGYLLPLQPTKEPDHAQPRHRSRCDDRSARGLCPRPARPSAQWLDRQRRFLAILAETGSVSLAANDTGIAPRSAYRLRAHPAGKTFSEAWDAALLSSTDRLLTLAFERATQGIPRDVWRDDKLISSTRQPSDKLMMFLLTHLLPSRFGPVAPDLRGLRNPVGTATYNLPIHLRNLADIDAPCELLGASDHYPERPKLDPA